MYPESVTSLPQLPGASSAGLCRIWVLPKDHVTAMWSFRDLIKNADSTKYPLTSGFITLASGKAWLNTLKYGNLDFELEEKVDRTPNGLLYSYAVAMMANKDSNANRVAILQAMDNREHIVIVKDMDGNYRLLGSYERGCDFNAAYKSNQAGKGRNAYECALVWQSHYRALFVSSAYGSTLP